MLNWAGSITHSFWSCAAAVLGTYLHGATHIVHQHTIVRGADRTLMANVGMGWQPLQQQRQRWREPTLHTELLAPSVSELRNTAERYQPYPA